MAAAPDPSLSGLREEGIEAADLAALHAAYRFEHVGTAILPDPHALDPALYAQSSFGFMPGRLDLQIRLEPPRRRGLFAARSSGMQALKLPGFSLKLQRDQALACEQRVRRERRFADELPRDSAKSLFSQLFEKFGQLAAEMEVLALFCNIPPECAGSIAIEENLQHAWFLPLPGTNPRLHTAGYYLVVLREESGKLRRVLFRLD